MAPALRWPTATWPGADGRHRRAAAAGWRPLDADPGGPHAGGHPNSGRVAARIWISSLGFTPVDAAALGRRPPLRRRRRLRPADGRRPSTTIPAELGAILATIRAMETGGDYTATITTSTASGAYGFLDSSWAGYGGYRRAKDAPPAVQDAKAAELATYVLQRNGGDVSTIPVSWYIGHVPVGAEWDTVPPYPAATTSRRASTRSVG